MKKTVFTLNIGNGYDPAILEMSYPLIKQWCFKIGAEFVEITERKFPEWQVTYEKLQIYQLAQDIKTQWAIFIDCDALINPDFLPDITQHIPRDTVAHNGADLASIRWKYDRFFQRDGRHIGSASWFCVASDWCIELFKPLDDLTPEQAYANIFPVTHEIKANVTPDRLIEDYVMSRNIAKYGLKFITLQDFYKKWSLSFESRFGIEQGMCVFHMYACPPEAKLEGYQKALVAWGLK